MTLVEFARLGITRPVWGRLALAVGLMALTLAAGIALTGTSTWLIATAATHPSIAALQVAVVGVRALGIGRAISRYLERLAAHDGTLRVLAAVRCWVFDRVAPLAPAAFARLHSGDVWARMVSDVDAIDQAILRLLLPVLAAFSVAAPLAVASWVIGPAVTAVLGVGWVTIGVVIPWATARLGRRSSETSARHLTEMQVSAVDTIQGLADLLGMGRDVDSMQRLEPIGRSLGRAQIRAATVAAGGSALAGLAADATVLAVLVLVLRQVGDAPRDAVALAVVTMVALASFEAVAGLPSAFQRAAGIRQAWLRLVSLGRERPAVHAPARPTPLPYGHAFEIRNLTFAYPGETRPALMNVSLTLRPATTTALVGPAGSGKSTLLRLLLRFWDVPPGSITLGGVDVRTLDPDAVRSRCSLVSQRTQLFTGTLRDNLRLGRPTATDDEVERAAARAGLRDRVAAWPNGYDTWLGDRGLHLSGGERRRVALARALLRNSPVLLLDEPTADLDVESERQLLREIARPPGDTSVLLVTHRLSALSAFADIVVLDRGAVVERGSYAQLRTAGGTFQSLLEQQRAGAVIDEHLLRR